MKIPQIFHRIWLGSKPMPVEFIEFGETWRRYHPNWEFRLWTEDNVPALSNSSVYHQSRSLAAKANVLRYEILHQMGGIYIDTDFECQRNIEPLLDDVECFVARQSDGIINNAIIGCTPQHRLMRTVVDRLAIHARYVSDAIPSVTQSGPYFFTKVVDGFPGLTIFPPELFYPYEWHQRWRRYETFQDAYAVHHWTLSGRHCELPVRHTLGDPDRPALAVLVLPHPADDGIRLEWVIESLCVQVVKNAEIFVVNIKDSEVINKLCYSFAARGLDIRSISSRHWQLRPVRSADLCNAALDLCRAPRLLILGGDCIPDADTLERHAIWGDASVAPFGFCRQYPSNRLYRYRAPFDYPGLRVNASPDPRRSYPFPAFFGDYRDVEEGGLSAPVWAWKAIGGFFGNGSTLCLTEFGRQLTLKFVRLLPLWTGGMVTRLLPSESSPDRVRGVPARALVTAAAHSESQLVDRLLRPRAAPKRELCFAGIGSAAHERST